jgi:hypothetical protein
MYSLHAEITMLFKSSGNSSRLTSLIIEMDLKCIADVNVDKHAHDAKGANPGLLLVEFNLMSMMVNLRCSKEEHHQYSNLLS